MRPGPRPEPIRLALEIRDPEFADQLAALLSAVPGLQLVDSREQSDVTLKDQRGEAPAYDFALTPRELEVLSLLAEGASNKMIARRLGISVHTAKYHVGTLIEKLDATGRTDAVTHAARLGVIHL